MRVGRTSRLAACLLIVAAEVPAPCLCACICCCGSNVKSQLHVVCSSVLASTNWKAQNEHGATQPWLLRTMFKNGFKNPVGALTMAGIFFLPLAVYVHAFEVRLPWLDGTLLHAVSAVLCLGKVLGTWAEFWVMSVYLSHVLDGDLKRE